MPDRRGRKPSIAVATAKVAEIRRTLKALVTETHQRLTLLDSFYSRPKKRASGKSVPDSTPTRRSNVRDLAFNILERTRKPLPMRELARRVVKARGRKSGEQFAQNLSVALGKDKRFKRVERGVYAVR